MVGSNPYRIAVSWFILAFLFIGTAFVAARQVMILERQADGLAHVEAQARTDKELDVRIRILEIQHGIPHNSHTISESE
jgi:hypothetical protein